MAVKTDALAVLGPEKVAAFLVQCSGCNTADGTHGPYCAVTTVANALRDYGQAATIAERERCQAIAARRASEWRAILSEQPDSVIADNRWHEACDIGALISQPDWDQPGA